MIEQFLTPQEWASVWCLNAKRRDTGNENLIMSRLAPYANALYERIDEAGLPQQYFIQIMTTLSMLEEAFEAKYKNATH